MVFTSLYHHLAHKTNKLPTHITQHFILPFLNLFKKKNPRTSKGTPLFLHKVKVNFPKYLFQDTEQAVSYSSPSAPSASAPNPSTDVD